MPLAPLTLLITSVIIAAGFSVWLITSLGPMALMVAVPVFLIATAALMYLRK